MWKSIDCDAIWCTRDRRLFAVKMLLHLRWMKCQRHAERESDGSNNKNKILIFFFFFQKKICEFIKFRLICNELFNFYLTNFGEFYLNPRSIKIESSLSIETISIGGTIFDFNKRWMTMGIETAVTVWWPRNTIRDSLLFLWIKWLECAGRR